MKRAAWLGCLALSCAFAATAAGAEQYRSESPPVKGLLFGAPDSFVELHGFVNVEAYGFQRQAARRTSSFDLHNWYLSMRVEPARQFEVFSEVEYEHGTQDIRLDRLFVDWSAFPWAAFRAGRFYVPASYERTHYWAPHRLMTSRPLVTDVAFHEWSDTGLEVYGFPIPGSRLLQYDLAVVNGPRGLSEDGVPVRVTQDDRDNNNDKSVVARLNATPLPGWGLGTAWSSGKYDDGGRRRFRIVEFDSRYARDRLDLWAEYMKRTGDDEPAPAAGNPFITGTQAGLQGWYALASYDLLRGLPNVHSLKGIVRYDAVKKTSSGAGSRRATVGLNWSPRNHVLLRGEYQLVREAGGAPQLKNDGAMFSAVVDF